MTPFLALIKNDLRLFFRDPRSVIMSFVAPILMGAFFGYVFGGAGQAIGTEPAKTRVMIANQDVRPGQDKIAHDVVAALLAEKTLNVEVVALAKARETVQKGRVPVAVVLPDGFGQQATQSFFQSGTRPAITLLVDPSHQIEAQMIEGILTGKVMEIVGREAIGGDAGRTAANNGLAALEFNRTLPEQQRQALMSLLKGAATFRPEAVGQGGFRVPFETKRENVTSKPGITYNAYGHSFAGLAVQFTLFMGMEVGIGLLLLRERGLWRRLRAAPLSRAQLLGSRTISATIITLTILTVVFGVARLVFDVRIEGSMVGFLAVTLGLGLMTATYGLLIAALGKTPEATRGLAILGTILMTMLSGAWIPSFLFPAWLQTATKAVPARWAVDGLDAMVWRGLPLSEALLPTLVLTGFAILFGTLALWRFRWDGQ
jgi:ABC-2 type transport system permease protein